MQPVKHIHEVTRPLGRRKQVPHVADFRVEKQPQVADKILRVGSDSAISRLKDMQVIDDAKQLHKSRGLLFRDPVTAMEFRSLLPFLNLL
jgi:hypothetical protein